MTVLHVEQQGQGTDLVMLHGWGMHSGIWHALVKPLRDHYRLHLVDLPGHGQSQSIAADFDLAQLADSIWQSVVPQLRGPAVWLGWSLGGMAAMQIARQHRDMVRALVLVASTPRFSQADDWPHAMSAAVLDSFAEQLAGDYKSTLQRFLALQVKGSDDARQVLRELRDRVLDNANVDLTALQSGLAILKQADLRAALTEIGQLPCLLIYGERDMLIPLEAVADIQALLTNNQTWIVKGVGHAPFILHPETFIKQLNVFLHETG